ncbi:MAG: HesA/MoeB/ThiF family protein [Burkholderiales bacterium]
MERDQLLRYSRHILLPQIGIEGQEALLRSHALVVGAGGLGSPAALYLGASGVGKLTLCDGDAVDLTNLQRQIAHRTQSVGINKAVSARHTLAEINPGVRVVAVPDRIGDEQLALLVKQVDVVVDASDNFATRHAINRACVTARRPLVSGAAVRCDGQLAVFDLRDTDSPCYHCLFPEHGDADELRCSQNGVFSPLVGIIGALQAAEALKLLMGIGSSLSGKLLMFDALATEWRWVKFTKDAGCAVCSGPTNQGKAVDTAE